MNKLFYYFIIVIIKRFINEKSFTQAKMQIIEIYNKDGRLVCDDPHLVDFYHAMQRAGHVQTRHHNPILRNLIAGGIALSFPLFYSFVGSQEVKPTTQGNGTQTLEEKAKDGSSKPAKDADIKYKLRFVQRDDPKAIAWKSLIPIEYKLKKEDEKHYLEVYPKTSYKGQDLGDFRISILLYDKSKFSVLAPNTRTRIELRKEQYESIASGKHPIVILQEMMYKTEPVNIKMVYASWDYRIKAKPAAPKGKAQVEELKAPVAAPSAPAVTPPAAPIIAAPPEQLVPAAPPDTVVGKPLTLEHLLGDGKAHDDTGKVTLEGK